MIEIFIAIVIFALAFALLMAIINKKMTNHGNFASTSVFSDMQNQEKRNAMETVIENKAGVLRFSQKSGEKITHSSQKEIQ